MAACPACGKDNPDGFQFCGFCAAPLTGESREQRKTVTVLFCDVTGSTALGESTDPEALRALLARYFERMKAIVEAHGGTVEKFIGDAVMAVFGVPVAHEDDGLRACRAAVEMRDALPELGVRGRIGVNTGEVVTGTAERLATGDAVNVAARLEQAAQPGEVLFGEATFALVSEVVTVEAVDALTLKGKSEPVPAFRLVGVGEAPERLHGDLFVGRERELDEIAAAWVRAGAEQRCELVTVVAEAGVGKSRLVAEALDRLDARVVRGRCLSYGEGITYWPVVEVVKQISARPSDPAAAVAIASLLGERDVGTSAEEIAWAFRKLLEEQAPLVCVFEDIHWAEETLLDLVEHVALLSAGAQVLLLCTARPELIERRQSWPAAVRLAPLDQMDVERLMPASLSGELREKIARAAGGNPLFVTEMVAMAQTAQGEVSVPPTLQALLAARLDQIDAAERRVLERGAVEGEVFHRGAVQALAPEEPQLTARLAGLVRRELVRPDRAQVPGEDGFRFRHLLVRDAAYEALPKAARAGLHERFASWLEQHGQELVELDEILGYHLEQAARYKQELGQPDLSLADRAGDRLAAAGRRALWRGDIRAAAGLLERALKLTRPIRVDVVLELDLARASSSASDSAKNVISDVAERARAAGDETGALLAQVGAAYYSMYSSPDPPIAELEQLARTALPLLEQAENHAGLAYVWRTLGWAAEFPGRYEDFAYAAEQALRHAGLAGRGSSDLFGLEDALVYGPRPADQALRTLDALLPENPHPASILCRASLLAMLARFDEAASIALEASARWRDLTGHDWGDRYLGLIAVTCGDHESAATHLRRACDFLEFSGERAALSTSAPLLGRSLCKLGRHNDAEPLAVLARELGSEHDAATQMLWRQVQALVDAHQGHHIQAEQLAREAVAISDRTDSLNDQGDALIDLADVLHTAGRPDEATVVLSQALERYERKHNVAQVADVRDRLLELHGAAPS